MDTLHKPYDILEPRKSPHRMSIQWHRKTDVAHLRQSIPETRKSKSLPNIRIEPAAATGFHPSISPNCGEAPEVSCKKRPCITSSVSHHSIATPPHHNKPKILKKTWDKVKTIIHNPPLVSSSSVRRESLVRKSEGRAPLQRSNAFTYSAPSTPLDKKATFDFEDNSENVGDERQRIARNYALLQKRLSEELHQRMSECGKSGGGGLGDESYISGTRVLYCGGGNRFPEHLSDEFRKRLQQWEMWKASTGKAHYTDEELKEIVPEEFGRKLLEWEVIRSGGGGQLENSMSTEVMDPASPSADSLIDETRKNKHVKKKSTNLDLVPQTQHQKELAWLDKQLEKIEIEKKRLEREMKKYLEREARLEKMKEALKNSPSSANVYIKTPTAKCRVEKITEKFAKKLYEWEEKQGIGPESSALGLLNPKYYDNSEEKDENMQVGTSNEAAEEIENREVLKDEDDGGDDGDVEEDEEVIGPLDLINARLNAAAEQHEETEQEKSVRRAMEHVAEALALAEEEVVVGIVRESGGGERVSSTASSCCCSAEYEYDQTDSFATKNNSGASNTTDSEFYLTRPDPHKLCTNTRRRSSDAISTPLSGEARSPSLSAFTSDDECETNGPVMLKRVSEEQDNDSCQNVSRHSTIVRSNNTTVEGEQVVRDAESQTDVVVRAKQIVVEEEDDAANGNDEGRGNTGIFVQTKRTIFAPIVGDIDSEKVVLIREDNDTEKAVCVGANAFVASSGIPIISSPVFGVIDNEEDDKPKVVGAIPKRPTNLNIRSDNNTSGFQTRTGYKLQPKTQFHRSFPKMGKIPVWCSPLVARKQMFNNSQQEQEQQPTCGSSSGAVGGVTTPDDSDFSIDRFLQDSKLLDAAMSTNVVDQSQNGVDNDEKIGKSVTDLPLKKPVLCSRLPRTNAFLPRKYTIGGGYPPRGSGSIGCVLTRSNSFGYPKAGSGGSVAGTCSNPIVSLNDERAVGSNVTLESFASSIGLQQEEGNLLRQHSVGGSMHSVTKSKSTGSIKSKFGRAFAKVGLGFGKDKKGVGGGASQATEQDQDSTGNQAIPNNSAGGEEGIEQQRETRRGSAECSGSGNKNPLRRFGSWVSKVGFENGGKVSGNNKGPEE